MKCEWRPSSEWREQTRAWGGVATLQKGPYLAYVANLEGYSLWTIHNGSDLLTSGETNSIMPFHYDEARKLCEAWLNELLRCQ